MVALLIWSGWPVVSNPVLWRMLGAVGGIIAFKYGMKQHKAGEGRDK